MLGHTGKARQAVQSGDRGRMPGHASQDEQAGHLLSLGVQDRLKRINLPVVQGRACPCHFLGRECQRHITRRGSDRDLACGQGDLYGDLSTFSVPRWQSGAPRLKRTSAAADLPPSSSGKRPKAQNLCVPPLDKARILCISFAQCTRRHA